MWNHLYNLQVSPTSEFMEGSSNVPNQFENGPQDLPNNWDSEGFSTWNISLMPLDPHLRSAIPQQPVAHPAEPIDWVCYSKWPYAYVSGAATGNQTDGVHGMARDWVRAMCPSQMRVLTGPDAHPV